MSQPPKLAISYGELRSLVIEYLAESRDDPTLQFNSLRDGVGRIAAKRELLDPNQPELSPADVCLGCDIVWDLIIEGVIRPGDSRNSPPSPHHFHVTERGRELLAHGSLSPYDPDGYLKRLDSDVPDLDPIIRTYLVESLQTFRIGSFLSSTITLGCASECAILNLVEAYVAALPKTHGDSLKKKTQGKMIKTQFDEFAKSAKDHLKSPVPLDLRERLEPGINSIFGMYRVNRNEAGHPTGKQLSRDEANANLILFNHYIKNVYALMRWLKDNAPLP